MLDKKDLELIAGVVNTAIQPINQRLEVIERDMASLKEDAAVLKEDAAVLKENVAVLNEQVAGLHKKTASLEQDMVEVRVKLDELDNRVRKIELTLENETNQNIRFIAEAHLDLDRKLNQAIKLSQDCLSYTEKFQLRQVCFECELSLMKDSVCKIEKRCMFCRQQPA